MYRSVINKSFLSDDELFCTAVNVLISKWKLQSLSACYVSRISSLLCPHRLCPTCVTCLQVCAVFSAGSVYCCLFSWNICAVHSVGCRLLSLAQVFAFDHHLVTFPPELGTPIRSLLQSVVLCTGAAAAGALLCKKHHAWRPSWWSHFAGWDHRHLLTWFAQRVPTSLRSGLRLSAHHSDEDRMQVDSGNLIMMQLASVVVQDVDKLST